MAQLAITPNSSQPSRLQTVGDDKRESMEQVAALVVAEAEGTERQVEVVLDWQSSTPRMGLEGVRELPEKRQDLGSTSSGKH